MFGLSVERMLTEVPLPTLIDLITWNLEWAGPRSRRMKQIKRRLEDRNPSIICLTETYSDSLDDSWHQIDCDPDAGYLLVEGRRKVVLASRKPWESVDRVGQQGMPPGRFVSGITKVEDFPVRVAGLCIPWSHAHVSTGRRDRSAWEDHLAYLDGLRSVVADWSLDMPTIILGDLNQSIPRRTAPRRVFEALNEALLSTFKVATAGPFGAPPVFAIDHVLHTDHFVCKEREVIPKVDESGLRLSDHVGIRVILQVHCTPAIRHSPAHTR